MKETEIKKLQDYRRERFAVEVKASIGRADPVSPGEFVISVTHNGYQWSTMNLMPDEARQMVKDVNAYLLWLEGGS